MSSRRGPDNTVRVAITSTVNGVNGANVFYCQLVTSSTPSQADLDAWLTAFQLAYKTRFAPRMENALAFSLATATFFTPGGGQLASSVAMTGNGTGGTGATSSAGALVLSWLTSVYWRGGKPRTYLPGLLAADVTSQHLVTPGNIAAIKTIASNFRADVNALVSGAITGTQLGFVSFRSGNVDRVPPVFFANTGVTLHGRIGTQRRRLGRWLA